MNLESRLFDTSLIKFSLASTTDFYEIKHFLKQHKENSASRNNLIYTIHYQTKLIGLARLVYMEDTIKPRYWLRGLYIEANFRQQGLATQLLDFMTADLKTRCNEFAILAFPYRHLKQFYKQNGFNAMDPGHLPASLQNSYQNALNQGKTWLSMAFIY